MSIIVREESRVSGIDEDLQVMRVEKRRYCRTRKLILAVTRKTATV
jgi:hypothetical protein